MSKPRGFGLVAVPWHETEDEDYAALVAELNAEGEQEMQREMQQEMELQFYLDPITRQEGPA